jgi:hypothetical protein
MGLLRTVATLSVLLVLLVRPPAAWGGQQARGQRVTLNSDGPIFVVQDETRTPLTVAREGTDLTLTQACDGDWCQVQFDDPQLGRRVGYIQKKHLNSSVPSAPQNPVGSTSVKPAPVSSPPVQQPPASQVREPSSPVTHTKRAPLTDAQIAEAIEQGRKGSDAYSYGAAHCRTDLEYFGAGFPFTCKARSPGLL